MNTDTLIGRWAAWEMEQLRPKTRADCLGQARPCPWMSCRYHLSHRQKNPSAPIELAEPDYDGILDGDESAPSCALDVADEGGRPAAEVVDLIGSKTHQAFSWIEASSRASFAAAYRREKKFFNLPILGDKYVDAD